MEDPPLLVIVAALALMIVAYLPAAGGLEAETLTETTWQEDTDNPVHDPGRAYYPTVIKEVDTYKIWHSGTQFGSFGIEMATSTDGVTWEDHQDASQGLASFSHHAHVEKIEDTYRIWYWDCCGRADISVLRTATSQDGVTWTDDQPLEQVDGQVITGEPGSVWNRFGLGLEEVLYNPDGADTIVSPEDPESVFENRYVAYLGNSNGGQQFVGLAVSADGVTWEAYQDGQAPVLGPSDVPWADSHVYPGSVLPGPQGYHMWFSAGSGDVNDGIGYAFSADGVSWTATEEPILHVDDGQAWREDRTYTPTVVAGPTGGEMWFAGDGTGNRAIGYAQGPLLVAQGACAVTPVPCPLAP